MTETKKTRSPLLALAAIIAIFVVGSLLNSRHTTNSAGLERLKDSYPIIASDLRQFGSPYNNVPGLPCTLFIGKEGKVKAMLVGMVDTKLATAIVNSDNAPLQIINPQQLINTTFYGKPAPNFIVKDINGNQHELSKLRGKEVMITFWATWCKYCRIEMPELIKMREEIPQDKLEMLSISFESEKTVRDFVEKPYI